MEPLRATEISATSPLPSHNPAQNLIDSESTYATGQNVEAKTSWSETRQRPTATARPRIFSRGTFRPWTSFRRLGLTFRPPDSCTYVHICTHMYGVRYITYRVCRYVGYIRSKYLLCITGWFERARLALGLGACSATVESLNHRAIQHQPG